MEESSWTSHVLAGAAWRRFCFMLIFVPILACALFLAGFTALFQFFSVLASGETNPQLTALGHGLARFSAEIMDYMTYNTEQRPFPFARWGGDDRWPPGNPGGSVWTTDTARPTTTRRKTRARAAPRRRGVKRTIRPPQAVPDPDTRSGGDEGPDSAGPGERPH